MKGKLSSIIRLFCLTAVLFLGIASIIGSGGSGGGNSDTTTTTTLPDGSTTTTTTPTTIPTTSTTTTSTSTTTTTPAGSTSTTTSTSSSTTSSTTTSTTSSTSTSTTTTTLPSQTPSLEGDWGTYTSGSVIYGLISFNASGTVTNGNWTEKYPENDNAWATSTGTFTGGQLSVDNFGSITGDITKSSGITNTVISGQLCPISSVAAFTGDEDGASVIIKRAAAYTPAGLAGDWFYCTANQHGVVQVDGNGNVTGGEWNAPGLNPDSGDITGGTLNFNSQGQISGTISSDFPNLVTIVDSQLDEYKEVAAATGSDASGYANMLIVKSGTGFATSDLQGTWHLVTYHGSGQISSSTLAIDASGNVIVNSDYTGGSLAITGDGSITGQVQTPGLHTVSITGQMNANNDFAALHLLDTTAPEESAFAAAVLKD